MATVRSALTVNQTGLSGRGRGSAVDAGRLTWMSTVASGAATMKMMSSTSITSMNGVTLISWTSVSESSPWSRRTLMTTPLRLFCGGQRRRPARGRGDGGGAIEIAAHKPQDLGGGVPQLRAIAGDRAREH